MRYFKNKRDEVYAYEDDADGEYILPDLSAITDEEAAELLNPEPTPEQLKAIAEGTKSQLRADADAEIAWLQDSVDADIATDEEKLQLAAWRKYRVLLMRVDTTDPDWPPAPDKMTPAW